MGHSIIRMISNTNLPLLEFCPTVKLLNRKSVLGKARLSWSRASLSFGKIIFCLWVTVDYSMLTQQWDKCRFKRQGRWVRGSDGWYFMGTEHLSIFHSITKDVRMDYVHSEYLSKKSCLQRRTMVPMCVHKCIRARKQCKENASILKLHHYGMCWIISGGLLCSSAKIWERVSVSPFSKWWRGLEQPCPCHMLHSSLC